MILDALIILALVLANGFFAGAEIAVVALRRTRLDELVAEGRAGAAAVLALRKHPERFLATVQIGITVVGASAAAFGGAALAKQIALLFARIAWLAPHADGLALGLVIALISYLSVVLGELVPKSLALKASEPYALRAGRFLVALSWLSRPLVWFLTASSNLVLRPLGDRTTFTETRHSPEELRQLLEESAEAGAVHPDVGEIATRALDFGELVAADVMVPRMRVVALPRDASPDELRASVLAHAHTRMPVYDGTIDNAVGYVNAKELLVATLEGKPLALEGILHPPFFAPETRRAIDVLRDMKQKRVPFAFVVDEHGGMSGIIAMEDLVEELVGEIFDERVRDAPSQFRREPDGTVLIDAFAAIRDINRELDVALPEEGDWSTLAGLCQAKLHRIPSAGDMIAFPGGLTLEIVEASAQRVRKVRLKRARVD